MQNQQTENPILRETERKSERNSALELLRIIAVFIIMGNHYSLHGGFEFSHATITLNRLWQEFIYVGGHRGNDLFVLISGYFLVSSQKIKFGKLLNIIVPIAFYGVLIFVLRGASGSEGFSLRLLADTVNYWWFVRMYIVTYLIHPYLNMFLNRISREEYISFLKAIFIYWCLIPTFTGINFGGSPFLDFVCVYSVGGYLRLWGKDLGNSKFILYGIALMLADWLIILIIDIIGLKYAVFTEYSLYFFGMMKPLTISAAVCFFLGFRKLNIPQSKIINTFAGASLGVYMLHENRFSQKLFWGEIFHTSSFTNSPYLIPYTFAVIFAVYIICALIEILRQKIFRTLSRGRLS